MGGPSIRLRLTAWNGGVVAAILVGLGVSVYLILAHALLERIDASLAFEYAELAEELKHGGSAGRLTDLPEAFRATYLLRVAGPDGGARLQSPALAGFALPRGAVPAAGGRPRRAYATVDLGRLGPHRVLSGAVPTPEGPLTVQIVTSLGTYRRELAALRAALLAILPAGLGAAVLGGYWLAGRALSPIDRMTNAARRITAQNLHERIEVVNPGDELGRLAATINAMLDRLDCTFGAMRQFTADASHELKTPLASMRAEAEYTLRAPRSPAQYAEVLESVVEEADRLAKLADGLLDLSREDAGGAPDVRRPFRVDEVVRLAAEHARPLAERGGIDVRLSGLPAASVEGDPERLRRVFDNLLDNAIKYNRPGGSVVVRGRCGAGRAVFEVADTGIGIAPEAQGRVFDRFYRVDPSRSRRTGGAGLGLSIAKALVEGLRGRIEVESEPGRGSTFRITLPLAGRA